MLLKKGKAEERGKAEGEQNISALSGKSVLLVDDSMDNRLLIENFLRQTNCTFDSAENGKEGIEKFKQGVYDIVLMDIQMPVMDGYAATAGIRKWEEKNDIRSTPVVAFTANAAKKDIEKCLNAGCSGYVIKPIKKKVLIEEIEHCLQGNCLKNSLDKN